MPGRERFFTTADRAKAALARRLGGRPEDIAFLGSASEGLHVASEGIDWRPGDNVVVGQSEFPSVLLAWQRLRPRGVEVRAVGRAAVVTHAEIADAVDRRTRAIAASHVSYLTGARHDLGRLRALADRVGARLVVDASHALGVVPVDGTLCDVVVACCYKWLLAVHGVGVFYVNGRRWPDLAAALGRLARGDPRRGLAAPHGLPPEGRTGSDSRRATRRSCRSTSWTARSACWTAWIPERSRRTCSALGGALPGRAGEARAPGPHARGRRRSARATSCSRATAASRWSVGSGKPACWSGPATGACACRCTRTTTRPTSGAPSRRSGAWRRAAPSESMPRGGTAVPGTAPVREAHRFDVARARAVPRRIGWRASRARSRSGSSSGASRTRPTISARRAGRSTSSGGSPPGSSCPRRTPSSGSSG